MEYNRGGCYSCVMGRWLGYIRYFVLIVDDILLVFVCVTKIWWGVISGMFCVGLYGYFLWGFRIG